MKITSFVSGSALLLAVWLGVTFVHEVSPQEYPSQRRSGDATTRVTPTEKKPEADLAKRIVAQQAASSDRR